MADLSTKQLRVLSHARALAVFTLPELSLVSGVSYETAKKVLRSEDGRTVKRTGERSRSELGRPADIWSVIDDGAITARLEGAKDELQGIELTATAQMQSEESRVDAQLAVAEDYLLFALDAPDDEASRAFASDALAALGEAPTELFDPGDSADIFFSNHMRRNLPAQVGRASIISALGTYLGSAEAAGIIGPRWRGAFGAIASVDISGQYALHKTLLVELVRRAHQRAAGATGLLDMPVDDLAGLILELASSESHAVVDRLATLAAADSQSGREALRRALAALIAELADGAREFSEEAAARVVALAARLFTPGSETQPEVSARLIDALGRLACSAVPAVALSAQEALIAIRQPRRQSFWLELASSAPVQPSVGVVFEGIAQSNVLAAFWYLRDEIDRGAPVAEVLDALQQVLPGLDSGTEHPARERFADFLASVSDESLRSHLAAAPLIAGLDWPVPSLEHRQMRELMTTLRRWKTLLHGGHSDARVTEERELLAERIEGLAIEILPLLTEEDESRACAAITTELETPDGAMLAVQTLLTAGREAQLAARVVATRAQDTELWHAVQQWYLDVCPRTSLDSRRRTTLVNALHAALPSDEAHSFFIGLALSRAHLPEIFDNAAIEVEFRVKLEKRADAFAGSAGALEDVAEAADFM